MPRPISHHSNNIKACGQTRRLQQKSPAENRGAFDLNIVMRRLSTIGAEDFVSARLVSLAVRQVCAMPLSLYEYPIFPLALLKPSNQFLSQPP